MPTPVQLPIKVIEHDVREQRREGRALRRAFLRRLHHAVGHDACLQVAPDQPEHLLISDPPCDPRHQRVVLDSVEERIQVEIDYPRRAILDGLTCGHDRVMSRAPRPEAEALLGEVRIEDGRQHLQ